MANGPALRRPRPLRKIIVVIIIIIVIIMSRGWPKTLNRYRQFKESSVLV